MHNEVVWIIGGGGGGKHIFVCKACGKLGVSGGMLPQGNFDFGPFIRHNLWNLGQFSHKHNLPLKCH